VAGPQSCTKMEANAAHGQYLIMMEANTATLRYLIVMKANPTHALVVVMEANRAHAHGLIRLEAKCCACAAFNKDWRQIPCTHGICLD
jgi:hypothetical protein